VNYFFAMCTTMLKFNEIHDPTHKKHSHINKTMKRKNIASNLNNKKNKKQDDSSEDEELTLALNSMNKRKQISSNSSSSEEEEEEEAPSSKRFKLQQPSSDEEESSDSEQEENNDNDALMQQIFSKQLSSDVEMRDDGDDEEESSNDDEEEDDTISNKLKYMAYSADDEEISGSDDGEDDDDQNIELSDLISSIDPGKQNDKVSKKDTTVSGKRLASLSENLSQLQRIAREKKKGDIYFNVDQTDLELQERRAAADFTDEHMTQWSSIVEDIQYARQVPLNYKEGRVDRRKSRMGEKPAIQDEFTTKVEKILQHKKNQSDIDVKTVPLFEEGSAPSVSTLAKQYEKMDKSELMERNREIIRKRRLMDMQKQKEARLKNIKSKTFRKIRNKEKRKQEEAKELAEEDLMRLDPEKARLRILEREKKYIEERISLRHKNSSKWVQRAMKASHHNVSLREAVAEQLKKGQDLLKKQTQVSASHHSDEEDELVEQMLDGDSKQVLQQLKEEVAHEAEENKGLFGMKFMKRARDKKRQEHMELIQEIEKDVQLAKSQIGIKVDPSDDEGENVFADIREPEGRRKFSGKKKNQHHHDEEDDEEIQETDQVQFDTNVTVQKQSKVVSANSKIVKENKNTKSSAPVIEKTVIKNESVIVNSTPIPEEAQFTTSETVPTKRKIVVTSVTKKKRKRPSGVDNTANPWLNIEQDYKQGRESKKQRTDRESKEVDVRVTTDQEGLNLKDKKKKKNSKSVEETNFERSIKQQAFAGDDLQLEFEEEKRKTLESEVNMPTIKSNTVPGWGDWVGHGLDWEQKLEENRRKEALAKKKIMEMKQQERADNKLGHVIIRATAKVPEKYLHASIAKHSASAKIFDNTMAHPIGGEWNTLTSVAEATQPRVKPRRGTIIAPLNYENAKSQMKYRKVAQEQLLNGGRTADVSNRMEDEIQQIEESDKNAWARVRKERQQAREATDVKKQNEIRESYENRLKNEY
jgi:U3 small nucleolar RNA-associated protein 14